MAERRSEDDYVQRGQLSSHSDRRYGQDYPFLAGPTRWGLVARVDGAVKGLFIFDHVSLSSKLEDNLRALKDGLEAAGFHVSDTTNDGFIHQSTFTTRMVSQSSFFAILKESIFEKNPRWETRHRLG